MAHDGDDGGCAPEEPAGRPAPRSYYNHYPERLTEEETAANRAGAAPTEVPSAEFEALATLGERMIYVVTGDRLLVSPRYVKGEHISHAVLADGGPVQAAGETEAVTISGATVLISLNNRSGHYRPGRSSLTVAREAFEARGVQVAPESLEAHPRSIS